MPPSYGPGLYRHRSFESGFVDIIKFIDITQLVPEKPAVVARASILDQN